MPSETARVFLLADTPEHDRLMRDFAKFLRTQATPTLEPVQLAETENGDTAVHFSDRREGDLLFALFDGVDPVATAAAVECCEQGKAHEMLIVPVFAGVGEPDTDTLLDFAERYPLHRIRLHLPDVADLQILNGILRTQIALTSPQSDLFLDWPRAGVAGIPAIRYLEEGTDARSRRHLAASAEEGRQQAARTIEARLFDAALQTLEHAASFDATSAITCHWRARLLAARNQREDLIAALREATRSARLANMNEPGCLFETAGWHLAAFVATRLGDEGAAREYIEEMRRYDHGDLPLALNSAALLLRIDHPAEALQCIDKAYLSDPETLDHALAMPSLAALHSQLDRLQVKRHAAVGDVLNRLFKSEENLHGHRPLPGLESARDAFEQAVSRSRDQTSPRQIEEELRASARRQIELLGRWAESLCVGHIELSTLRRRHTALCDNTLEMPTRSPWDGPLEFVWPAARRLRDALDTARKETRALRSEAEAQLEVTSNDFLRSLRAFLAAVGDCEAAIAEAPMLFSHRAEPAAPVARELAFLTAGDFARLGLKHDPTLLPDALAEYLDPSLPVPPARVPGIYRMEVTDTTELGASRCGVYFHGMREAE